MAHSYRAVGWNRQKKIYDAVLLGAVAVFLLAFVTLNLWLRPNITAETLLIRAFAVAALLLLHVILSIGPLCRIDRRFLPLLYNRRHMGVTMFVLAAVHGIFALIQFHFLGDLNPLVSLLAGDGNYTRVSGFAFQPLGLVALVILFLMAATSHDFWLANLTAPVWKALHMGVYVAYGLIIAHVALGVLQVETDPMLAILLALGLVWVLGLHLSCAWIEHAQDRTQPHNDGHWVYAGPVNTISENRARAVNVAGDRVAIFRYGDKLSAISGICQHQNGPLSEGCIIDGLVTCPWHGYQYDPQTGASPAPFNERVPTFNLRVHNGEVWVDARPNPPGTRVDPLPVAPRSQT